MTAPPQIIERALTVKFAQSVSTTALGATQADIMEVAVIPLNDASSNNAGATFAGGLKSVQIALEDPLNYVTFNLVPSYSPGLTAPINYRIMWRAGVMARTFTYDFSMPDQDISWDQIASLNYIIDGATYLQQSDLGVPGRVARLNSQGQVIDASGTPVAGSADITTVTNLVGVEKVARQQGDAQVRAILEGELNAQVASTLSTANVYTDNKITSVNSDLATERGSRISADNDLQTQLNNAKNMLQAELDSLAATTGTSTTALSHKADLDSNGKVLTSQIPDSVLTNAVPVADQAAMTSLPTSLVHKGSLAIRPDGVFLLTDTDPTQITNWANLTTVSAVNNKRGNITLNAADVGAIPTGGSVSQSQVTGLSTALTGKANQADLLAAIAMITALQNDTTVVHTVNGVVPYTLLDSNMVYINNVGQLVKKDGSIIPITGGGGAVFSVNSKTGLVVLTASDVGAIPVGGSVAQSQVTGLSTALGNKANAADLTAYITSNNAAMVAKADLINNLIPLGEIPTLPTTQVTGLSTTLINNGLTTSSNAVNRIASLEAAVASGGGGGGGGISNQAEFWTSSNTTTPVTNLANVNLHSPWGIDSDGTITGTTGTWYYLYTGVRGVDAALPIITANGHLQLRKINEANPADPVYALQSDLTTLTGVVNTKAANSDLTTLSTLVGTKANSSDLTALSTRVDGKASQADLNATNSSVAAKANASDLANLATTVGLKANQSDLTSTNTTVAGKADSTTVTALTTRVSTAENALTTKADLSGGVLATGQIPNVPQNKVTGLATTLLTKADLVSGTVPLSQLPTNIPIASIANLGTSLGAKADLVGGVVPLSQIPLGALPNIQVVANRAALLALTLAQVQYGDLALITGTGPDKGTYVLTGNDPSIFSNWTALTTPDAPVVSINGQTGTVVLAASDVGALAANAAIPISQITGLQTALSALPTTYATLTQLLGKTSPADVQNMFFTSSMVKRADYVSTTSISSLAGQQSIDGVLVPNGALVLLTAQPSSVNNGLWTVSGGGNWVRPADYASTSFIARDTIVIVSNATGSASGVSNPSTVWQMTSNSGFIDTNTTSWTRIAWVAPPFIPVAGNGISISGSTISANPAVGGGLVAASGGLSVDTAQVPKKFLGSVPATGTVVGITHNLNTTSPVVSLWDTASNVMVLAGITVTSANAISIEFKSAPTTGQYRVAIIG